eukprot:gene16630-5077_t
MNRDRDLRVTRSMGLSGQQEEKYWRARFTRDSRNGGFDMRRQVPYGTRMMTVKPRLVMTVVNTQSMHTTRGLAGLAASGSLPPIRGYTMKPSTLSTSTMSWNSHKTTLKI